MAHPLDAFKLARKRERDLADAGNKDRRDRLLFECWTALNAHVGEEAIEHVTISLISEAPPRFKLSVADHIPVTCETIEGQLRFTVRRRFENKTFDHFADALHFGEPFPMSRASSAVTELAIDTTQPE